MRIHTIVSCLLVFSLLRPPTAVAQEPPAHADVIEVIGMTPVDGIGLDIRKFPTNAQRVVVESDVATSLAEGAASVERNEPQGAPLQADLQFRGFAVSPLLGTPEGLAVFQDGVRLNEPFGDTISWSTIPSAAIATADILPGANPLFGLNALGGAIAMRTRSAAEGTALALRGGSFGRLEGDLTTGAGDWFAAASHLRDAGWRDFSPSEATQLFAAKRLFATSIRLTVANATLTGNGAAPEALLAHDRTAVFTHPDETRNDLAMLAASRQHALDAMTFLEGTAYVRASRTRTFNGDDSPYEACDDAPDVLCLDDEQIFDLEGSPVVIDPSRAWDATNNRSRLDQTAFGLTIQADRGSTIRGRANRIIGGAAIDAGIAEFDFSTEVASLTDDRGTRGSGIVVADSLVRLATRSRTIGAFAADVFTLSPRTTITATARFNHTRIRLDDRLGTRLEGDHSFAQLHPSIGGAVEVTPALQLFANVAMAGRAPTPVELTCADPEAPCRLPNAFVSDPPLDAVTAMTLEAGARGRVGGIAWRGALHRSTSEDDILFISSGPLRGEGHFTNVGATRRQGVELAAEGILLPRLRWSGRYAFLDAHFVTPFTASAPNHPDAVDSEIAIEAGDRLPLVPRHTAHLAATLDVSSRLTVNGAVRAVSSQYLRGDEANLAAPLDGYTSTDVRITYALTPSAVFALDLRNAFDTRYETFGTFGEAGEVLGEEWAANRRFVTPAAPRSLMLGLEVRF